MHAKSNFFRPHGLQPTRLLCPCDSPGKNIVVGCHALLQGIFLTQRSSPCLLQLLLQIFYYWATREAHGISWQLKILSRIGVLCCDKSIKHVVKRFFFDVDHFKRSLYYIFIISLQFFIFWPQSCEILVPQPGIKPTPPALEHKVLTTGPPGKSLKHVILT